MPARVYSFVRFRIALDFTHAAGIKLPNLETATVL
jgi:hypothetical protein